MYGDSKDEEEYIDTVSTAFNNSFTEENIDVLQEHEEGLFVELNEFYEDVNVREISDSVGELMGGVLGGITVDYLQKKRYYGGSLN